MRQNGVGGVARQGGRGSRCGVALMLGWAIALCISCLMRVAVAIKIRVLNGAGGRAGLVAVPHPSRWSPSSSLPVRLLSKVALGFGFRRSSDGWGTLTFGALQWWCAPIRCRITQNLPFARSATTEPRPPRHDGRPEPINGTIAARGWQKYCSRRS